MHGGSCRCACRGSPVVIRRMRCLQRCLQRFIRGSFLNGSFVFIKQAEAIFFCAKSKAAQEKAVFAGTAKEQEIESKYFRRYQIAAAIQRNPVYSPTRNPTASKFVSSTSSPLACFTNSSNQS